MTEMITRRGLLAGLGALSLAVTGCNASAGDAPSGTSSSTPSQAFSWTDGRGKKIDLTSLPTVVVAQSSAAASLWDFGFKVKGAYGELAQTDGKLNYQAGNLDLSQLTVIGSTYGEFDVEKYAALAPQLLIDLNFTPGQLWYVPANVSTKVEALAPTLGVEMLNLDLVQIIEEFSKLSAALGADVTASSVTSAKTDFEASAAKIKEAVAAKPDLTVLGLSADDKTAFIANPKQSPDLAYMQTLGVRFAKYDGKDTDYFEQVSWEKIDDYAADVILVDARSAANKTNAEKQATYRALGAVKAGQVYDWKPAAPYSWLSNAPILAAYAENLSGAKTV